MSDWPIVLSEQKTVEALRSGKSIARFGDGEMKMMFGAGYVRQRGGIKLATELYEVMTTPHKDCLIGIPTMHPDGPKYESWIRHRDRFAQVLSLDRVYHSAFISRPDSAPWIETRAFAESLQSLWVGKRVIALCEKKGRMIDAVRAGEPKAIHLSCPTYQAYDGIDAMEQNILRHGPEIVVMACGPSATCLANRLAKRGVQAIDLGSAGSFILRALRL